MAGASETRRLSWIDTTLAETNLLPDGIDLLAADSSAAAEQGEVNVTQPQVQAANAPEPAAGRIWEGAPQQPANTAAVPGAANDLPAEDQEDWTADCVEVKTASDMHQWADILHWAGKVRSFPSGAGKASGSGSDGSLPSGARSPVALGRTPIRCGGSPRTARGNASLVLP